MPTVRWETLFADLEARLDAAQAQERLADVAERTRAERAAVLLADRWRAATGAELTLRLRGGEAVRGEVVDAAASWVLLRGARQHLVPAAAVVTVAGLPPAVAAPAGTVARRLGLGHALRAVARDRSVVHVVTVGGAVDGRVDAVGADHVDVALAYADSGRPTGAVVTVPFDALDVVSGV